MSNTARVVLNDNDTPNGDKAGGYMQGIQLPYQSKKGFPVLLGVGDDSPTSAEEVPAPAGTIGIGLDNQIYVVDINGSMWPMGLKLPSQLAPQPLDVDENHPFFAAARRGQEAAATAEEIRRHTPADDPQVTP